MASEVLVPTRPLARHVPARSAVAEAARVMARIAFGLTIVLSPFASELVLVSRPVPPVFSNYTDFRLSAAEMALLATLAFWALHLVAAWRPVSLGPGFLRWPVLGVLALIWLGVPFSMDPALSAYNAVKLVVLAAFALYALNEVRSIAGLALPLAAMIAIQSVVGLGQLAEQRSLGLGALGEFPLDPARNGVSVVAASGVPRLLRAYGLTGHPNILGGLLAFALVLLAFVWPWRGRRWLAGALLVALATAALFATFSRAAWLAAAAGFAVAVVMSMAAGLRPRIDRRTAGTILAGALLAAALLIPFWQYAGIRAGVADSSSVTEAMSIGERSILADQALRIAAAHPLTGTGLGTMPLAVHAADPSLTFAYQPAHVVVLDVAAETGIVAALLFAFAVVAPWVALWRARRRWTRELAAASGALAAVTIAGFFDYYTWTWAPGRIWAWLVLGLWAAAYARARAEAPDAR